MSASDIGAVVDDEEEEEEDWLLDFFDCESSVSSSFRFNDSTTLIDEFVST
jgi:hypothetical protein